MNEFLQQILSFEFLALPATVVTALLTVMLLLYWCGTRGFADLKKLNVPGPKPLPFLGNYLDIYKYGGPHLMFADYVKKYGKVFAVCLGAKPSLVVADPEMIKQILVKDFANFRNRVIPRKQPPPLNKSVMIARDESWKRIRSTLTPTFSAGKMKLMVPLIEESCDTLLEKLGKIADSNQSVDMLDWFSKLTLEVILSTAFGVDAKVQTDEASELLRKAKEVFRVPQFILRIARLPFGNFIFKMIAAIKGRKPSYFPGIVRNIIDSRRQQGFTGRKDLLQLMLTAHEETTVQGVSKLTDEEIVAQSVIFLLAGYETSSNTLSFALYHLAVNPDVQDKLRAEIKDAAESNPKMPLYDLANSIEYLDCVIKESQRFYPPAASTNRQCANDYDLNGIHIPAGMEVVMPIYALHHDPDAWPEPEKFDPERFRGPAKDARHPFQFMPFGAGPRNCIGMRFALLEIKIALMRILTNFRFVQSPKTQVPLVVFPGLTLSAKDGVLVRVESVN